MSTTPAFQMSYDFYRHLYVSLRQIPKQDRFTWGERSEGLALELLKIVSRATYSQRENKRKLLATASETVDDLKIFLRLGFDLKILDQKKYLARQLELQEIGKMLGGWLKSV